MDNTQNFKNIISKIEQVRRLNITGAQKLQNATEECVQRFSSLIRRIESTVKNTREILDLMKKKMNAGIVRESFGKADHPHAIRANYEKVFNDLNDQMSLILEHKNEECSRLTHILNQIKQAADDSKEKATRNALSEIGRDIEDAANLSKTSADVISGFIFSTIFLLQDLVLSLADSFIRINAMMENTLGQSSSFRDDISEIVVNLQCEDICQEMAGITIKTLSSALKELYEMNIIRQEEINILQQTGKTDNISDEVTFFD